MEGVSLEGSIVLKSWVYFAIAAGFALAVPVGGGASATASPALDPMLVPAVHAEDVLRYDEVDRLTGSVKHTQREQITRSEERR